VVDPAAAAAAAAAPAAAGAAPTTAAELSFLQKVRDFYTGDFTRGAGLTGMDKAKAYGMGTAKALGTAGALGGLGYGAYRAMNPQDEAKVAYYLKVANAATEAAKAVIGDNPTDKLEQLSLPGFSAPPGAPATAAELSFLDKVKDFYTGDFTRGAGLKGMDKAKAYGLGAGKALGTAGLVGGLGYGAYRAMRGGEDEAKVAGYEFAKLAEARAAEIMAANGIHPETFESIEPVSVKIANVVTPDDVFTYEEKVAALEFNNELNTAATHILSELGLV
jgi:hypothetical protein